MSWLNALSQANDIPELKQKVADLEQQVKELDAANSTLSNDLANEGADLAEAQGELADLKMRMVHRYIILDERLDPDPYGRQGLSLQHRFESMRITHEKQIEV